MQDTKVKSKNSMLGKKPKPEKKGAANSSPSGQKSPNLSGAPNEGSKRMNKKRKANNSDTPNSGGNKKQKVEEFSGTKNLTTPEGKTSEKKGEGKPRRHNKFSEYHKALERANSGIIARQTELRRLNDRIKELASRSKLSKTGRRKLANFRSLVAKLGNGNAPEAAQSEGIVQKLVNAKQAKKRKLKPEEKPDDSEGEEKDSDDEDSEEQAEDVKRTQKDKSQLEDSIEEESEDDSEDDEEDSADNENSKDDVKEFMDVEMKNGEEDSEEDDDDEEESDDDDDDSNKEMEEGNSTITEDDEDVKKPSVKAKNPEKKPKFEEKKSVNRNDTSFKRDSNNFSVFVANLSYEATKSDVEDVFSKLDGFVAVRMSRGTTPDKHKGFAFVEMKDQESYDRAMELNGTDIGGRAIRVQVATPRSDGDRSFGNSGNQFGSRGRGRGGDRGGRGRGGDRGGRGAGRGGFGGRGRGGFGGRGRGGPRGGNNRFSKSPRGRDF